MNLALFALLAMLLVVAWQVFLEIYNLWLGNRFLGKAYREKWAAEIEAGEMPPGLRRHLIDVLYQHRFGWFLLAPTFLVGIFLILVVPYVLTLMNVEHSSNAGGTITIAVVGLPVFAFVWFIRAYERDRELTREEHNLWSSQFNELMKSASDYDEKNRILQRTAIRQLQDYLSGAKWKTNRRSNNTAIFELFSSIVANEKKNIPSKKPSTKGATSTENAIAEQARTVAIYSAKRHPLILSVSAVLQAVFSKRGNAECRVQVSQNSLEHMCFDLLTLDNVNFSGLKAAYSSFDNARMWRMSLVGTKLFSGSFKGADLFLADLTGAKLMWAKFVGADLSEAILKDANLTKADLSDANIAKADLTGAILISTNLSNAKLSGADLSGVNLSGANLRGADLHDAECREVILSGANLAGANLGQTGLTKNGVTERHKDVKYDSATIWDDSL